MSIKPQFLFKSTIQQLSPFQANIYVDDKVGHSRYLVLSKFCTK